MNYKDPRLSVTERVADLLPRMTLDEKVAQLSQVYVLPENRRQVIERLRETGLGSRILDVSYFAANLSQSKIEIEDLNELQHIAVEGSRLGIPLIHGQDVIHGQSTGFPIPLAMAATFDPQTVETAYMIAAREAAHAGVHWSFAPMLDIARDPRWGRIIEGFGEDPFLGSRMAAAAVRGFQGPVNEKGYLEAGHILACAKHYIGYGAAEGGRDYNTSEITDNTLRNIYLPPFKAAVEAGVGSIMSAFEDLNGESASGSHYLLTDLLRGELGFAGFVISDWGSVADLILHRLAPDERTAAQIAFLAGVDMEMTSDCYLHHLAELVTAGIISQERLDEAVGYILAAKFKLGLFEHPYPDPDNISITRSSVEHHQAAQNIALRSTVLLKNDGLLPLKKEFQRIAVIGPYAEQRRALLGSWINDRLAGETQTFLEAIASACPKAELFNASTGLYDEMLMAAAKADVVLLALGESNTRNGEYNCVASLSLPAGQEALAEAVADLGKPLVTIVFAGRPVTLTHLLPRTNALLYAWHPGSMGAAAVCELIFGDKSPSGKLPVTFPRTEGQIPVHYNHKSTGKRHPRYHDMSVEPLFPFGFGLSYTTIAYSDLAIRSAQGKSKLPVIITAVVTNTGDRSGEEIAQCYLQDCVSSLTRPERELKGFVRISLQPGESRTVEFRLGENELSYYGRNGTWILEPGEFKVWIGGNSQATLEGSFII